MLLLINHCIEKQVVCHKNRKFLKIVTKILITFKYIIICFQYLDYLCKIFLFLKLYEKFIRSCFKVLNLYHHKFF